MIGQISRFASAAKNFDPSAPMTDSRWLGAGRHAVVIEDSDAAQAEDKGKISLVFRTEDGKVYKDGRGTYVMTRDGHAFSADMRMLLGATLPDVDAQKDFRDLLSYQHTATRVLESFRGMKVVIDLVTGPGYRIDYDVEVGIYRANDALTEVELDSDKSVSELKTRLKANGLNRSFCNIQGMEVLDEESKTRNLEAFSSVVASIKKSQAATPTPAADKFAGHTGSTTGK